MAASMSQDVRDLSRRASAVLLGELARGGGNRVLTTVRLEALEGVPIRGGLALVKAAATPPLW
jgi:hypothetical protein